MLDDTPITGYDDNPLASGPGKTGLNLGTLAPGAVHHIRYELEAVTATGFDDSLVASSYSTRESVAPVPANRPPLAGVAELAEQIAQLPGVAHASQLSLADLGLRHLSDDIFGESVRSDEDLRVRRAYASNDETSSRSLTADSAPKASS